MIFSPRNEDKKTEIFVFLDSGSEVSYITDELTKKLNLPKLGEGFLEVYTFQGNKSEKQQSGKYLLGIERKDGKNEIIELLSINKIANELRSVTINEICGHLKLKDIKNNLVTNYGKPDLLIGCYLVNTTIGSVICGENQKISLERTIPVQTHVAVKSFEEMPSESEIKSWWDLQSIDKFEQTAENLLIKIVQKEKIDEFNKWEIFEDETGIKRLKSRIKNSDANFELENPVIIPKNSEILPLLINNIHEKFKHVGVQKNPDVPGLIPLRPVDFLCPKRNLCLELEIPKSDDSIMNFVINYKDSFVFTEFLLNELWKRWKKEYLIWLRDRSQWTMKGPRSQTKREPNVGEIVILEEEFVPRNLWKIAKIIELLDTKDGRCVRNVKILLPNGTIVSRPINRLYPLELNIENKEIENNKNKEIEGNLKEKIGEKPKEIKTVNQINIISKEITKNLVNISTMLFTFCLILILSGLITAKTQCNDCLVECNDKGILISSPEKIDKYEICCSDGPCTTHSRVDQFQFEINKEILVTHHHCEVNFWSKTKNILKYEVKCEPSDLCKLIPCYFCLERMINHTCSPFISLFLIACSTIAVGFFVCLLCCILKNTFKLISCCFPRKIKPRNLSRNKKRWTFRKRLLVLIIFFINVSNGEIISRTARTETCFRKNGKIDCSWNFVETLTMTDNKERQTIVLKDNKNKILGQINLTPEGFKMKCEPILLVVFSGVNAE
uniref:DUF5641 domain-containing protein n=1 Tax=Meloidogyne floridensis TaxID=298350 RepID=A0A915PBM7_9BILA